MWFLVVLFTPMNMDVSRVMAMQGYPSHTTCMADARYRARAMVRLGMHGRYLCMYHGEPDGELAVTAKRAF